MSQRSLNPVAWTEGMFLRPQHLQHEARYGDERLRYHLHTLDPFHWGVRELEIDQDALADHRISLLHLEAVLPSGLIVRHPGNAIVEEREFDPAAEQIDVHLAVRRLASNEPNLADRAERSTSTRYSVDSHEIADLARGGFEAPIELAHPNVRLLLSGEEDALDLYESFKVAEIVATGELKRPFELSKTYAPPLLRTQAHEPLQDEIIKVVSQIAAKLRVVAGRTTTIAVGDLPRMWMRYSLARMTPVLRHLLGTGETRPFDLYTALVETAAALGAFAGEEAADLPRYDHRDLYACFRGLIRFIDLHLGEALPSRFTELVMPFDAAKKMYATEALNTQLVDPRNFYYLGIRATNMDSQELAKLAVDHGKASSRSGVTTLVMLNTKGLRIEHLPAAPTEIAGPAGLEYFKLEPRGAQWNKVREDFSLALSLGKLENAEVRLYVVVPES